MYFLISSQVKFEGDQEAALITFSTNQEAYSCYKCSEPVFNNRFVKLFWHNKNKTDAAGNQVSLIGGTLRIAGRSSPSRHFVLLFNINPFKHTIKLPQPLLKTFDRQNFEHFL